MDLHILLDPVTDFWKCTKKGILKKYIVLPMHLAFHLAIQIRVTIMTSLYPNFKLKPFFSSSFSTTVLLIMGSVQFSWQTT